MAAENGVVVSTRVPTNIFTFAVGEYLSITGTVEMKLAGSGRRLHADDHDGTDEEEDLASSFALQVALQQEMANNEDLSTNSANSIGPKALILLGTICSIAISIR